MPAANVRVTAWLAEPIAGPPPHLDALLEHSMVRVRGGIEASDRSGRHTGLETPSRQRKAPAIGRVPIPIERTTIGGWPVARCSSPIYTVSSESEARLASRLSADYLVPRLADDQLRSIHHGSGSTRAQYRPIRLLHVERVVWFARAYVVRRADGRSRGAPRAELLRRLKCIASLGKYTGHGYGRVSKWEVVNVQHDHSWYANGDDGPILMRVLPADADHPAGLSGYRETMGACCSPYWHPDRITRVIEPC